MKILKIIGYSFYAAIPVGTIFWALYAGIVEGVFSFFAMFLRVAICYAAALAASEFGIRKILFLYNWLTIQSDWVGIIVRYVAYVISFFGCLFLLDVMLLGDSISGNDGLYPYMRR